MRVNGNIVSRQIRGEQSIKSLVSTCLRDHNSLKANVYKIYVVHVKQLILPDMTTHFIFIKQFLLQGDLGNILIQAVVNYNETLGVFRVA